MLAAALSIWRPVVALSSVEARFELTTNYEAYKFTSHAHESRRLARRNLSRAERRTEKSRAEAHSQSNIREDVWTGVVVLRRSEEARHCALRRAAHAVPIESPARHWTWHHAQDVGNAKLSRANRSAP